MSRTRYKTETGQWNFVGRNVVTGQSYGLPIHYMQAAGSIYDYCAYSSMTDVLTPKGQERAWNAVNHIKITGPSFGDNIVMIHYSYPIPDCELRMAICAPITITAPTGIPSADWVDLINKLADQLNGRIDEGSLLLVTLAEARKTIQMVKNPFSLLKPDWRKRAEGFSARDLAKRGANIWLEHLYGWKACYWDIQSVSKTAAALYSQPKQEMFDGWFQRYSAGSTASIPPTDSWVGFSDSQWATMCSYFPITNYSTLSAQRYRYSGGKVAYNVGCRSVMDLQLRYSRTRRFLNAFGLDAPSIVSTLWELVPMSFVIDWFVDTRGIWAAIPKQRLLMSDVKQLGTSELIEVDNSWQFTFGRTPFYAYGNGTPWKSQIPTGYSGSNYFVGKGKYKSYRRTTGLPDTSLITSGFLTRGLNLSQAVSGISLILQRALT